MRRLLIENTLINPIEVHLSKDKNGAPGEMKINGITVTKKNLKHFNLYPIFSNKIADVYSALEVSEKNYIWVENAFNPTYIINYKNLRGKRVIWSKIGFENIIKSLTQDEVVLNMLIKSEHYG